MDEKRKKRDYEIRASLGKRLKEFRDKYNLTQEQFSEDVGLSQHRYSQIEQGKVDFKISSIIKIVSKYEELSSLFPLLSEEIHKRKNILELEEQDNKLDSDKD